VRLNYRPQFIADVEEGADHLTEEAGEKIAAEWLAALKERLRLIARFPEVGRIRRDQPNIRTINLRKFTKFLVFYRVEKGAVELLRVKHGMMHLPGLFAEE
jgi:plasmid stabilization system protein ParE